MAIEPKEQWQKTGVNYNEEDLYTPRYVQEFFVNNILQRVLAHLYAWNEAKDKVVRIKATEDGLLLVSAIPPVYEGYEVAHDPVDPTAGLIHEATNKVNKAEVWVFDGPVLLEISSDGSVYGQPIRLPANSYYKIETVIKSIRYTALDPNTPPTIQTVFWGTTGGGYG